MKYADEFVVKSEEKAFDLSHRDAVNASYQKYKSALATGISKYKNLEASKRKAHLLKWWTMENLDKLLPQFETNFQKRGGKVIWANTIEEAQQEILQIIQNSGSQSVIKTNSTVCEEIELDVFLAENQISSFKSDSNSYLLQQLKETGQYLDGYSIPSAPDKILQTLSTKLGTAAEVGAKQLTQITREQIRKNINQADVCITGVNFLVAETGSVALCENEGNIRLATSSAKIHIAIAGIEKLVAGLNDLDLLWPLLASHASGQNLTAYNTLLNGPRQISETDGPTEMFVILLDNGRSQVLAQKEQRQALNCIQCGACAHVCPVHQNIGKETYNSTYAGPIGSIITPHTRGMKNFKHLSEASTLCGKCTEVCPMNINIHQMLLLNRRDAVEQGLNNTAENLNWKLWKKSMMSRKWLDFWGAKMKNMLLKRVFKKSWTKYREAPKVAPKSFSQYWEEKRKQDDSK